MITRSTAVLACANVQQAVDFYCQKLGFKQHWLWEDPPTFAAVGLGEIEIFLGLQSTCSAKLSLVVST